MHLERHSIQSGAITWIGDLIAPRCDRPLRLLVLLVLLGLLHLISFLVSTEVGAWYIINTLYICATPRGDTPPPLKLLHISWISNTYLDLSGDHSHHVRFKASEQGK